MLKSTLSLYRNAFGGLGRDVWLLSLIGFINRVGTMVFPFLTLYFINQAGFTRAQAGLMLLVFGGGSLIGSFLGGMLCTRFGPIRVLSGSLCLSGLAFLFFPLLDGYYPIMAGSFVIGMLGDAFRPAIMTAVTDRAQPENQTRAFALLRMALHVGIAIGPAIAGILAAIDYDLLFICEGITCMLAGLTTPLLFPFRKGRREAKVEQKQALPQASPFKDGPFMAFMAVVLGFSLVLFQFMGVYPLFLNEEYGMPENKIGMILGINALILVVLEMVVVHALEDQEPIRMFGIGAFVVCVGWALLPLGSSFAFAIFAMTVFTLGEMVALPFSNTLVALRAGKASGAYMGVYTSVFALAIMLGPPAGIWCYELMGPQMFWYSFIGIGALLWGGCLLVARYFMRENQETESEQGDPAPSPA